MSRPVLTGYVGSLGSVTRRQLGTCLPHLDMSGKARLSKYMGQYRVLRRKKKQKNKRQIVHFVAPGMTSLRSTGISVCELYAASVSASHTQHCDPKHVQCETQHIHPMHAATGSITFKGVFYLTRDALFSYFSILRAEMVTPLSGELNWDCFPIIHCTHNTPPPPIHLDLLVVL